MISTLAVGLVIKKKHSTGSGRLFNRPAVCVCVCVLNHSIISILSKFPDLICSPVMTLRNSHNKASIKGGVCLKATQGSLYTFAGSSRWPLGDRVSNTPIDRWEMLWITERNFSVSLSLCLLIAFCVKKSPWPDVRKCFCRRRGAYFLMSTVVTVNLTPFSHRTMKSLWQKGQFPTFSPSCPA